MLVHLGSDVFKVVCSTPGLSLQPHMVTCYQFLTFISYYYLQSLHHTKNYLNIYFFFHPNKVIATLDVSHPSYSFKFSQVYYDLSTFQSFMFQLSEIIACLLHATHPDILDKIHQLFNSV